MASAVVKQLAGMFAKGMSTKRFGAPEILCANPSAKLNAIFVYPDYASPLFSRLDNVNDIAIE